MHPWSVSVHLPQTPGTKMKTIRKTKSIPFYCAVVICTASCLPVLNCSGSNRKYRVGTGDRECSTKRQNHGFLIQNNLSEQRKWVYFRQISFKKMKNKTKSYAEPAAEEGSFDFRLSSFVFRLSSFVFRLSSHRQQNKSYGQIAVRFR